MNVLKNIMKVANKRKMSLSMIAMKSGVAYERIRKWSSHMPAADSLAKVAKALGTTSEELLKEE